MMSQLVVKALARGGDGMVPILVRVQQLQKRLLEEEDAFATSWNWIDAFLRLKHGEDSALYRTLRQAMMARRALLLIDGIDEGGKARERIERHLAEVLAPQGHVLLATSRPAGIDENRYAGFHRLALSGLSDAQQQQALEQRLGVERAVTLLPYLRERMPVEDGERITSNPLMLSLVASIFELRRFELAAMPTTVAELYGVATKAMLDRATPALTQGREVDDLSPLVIEICFQAHLSEDRVISDTQLQAAADAVPEGRRLLPALKARVLQDKLPLFTLLQVEPVQIQTAHLSFQEYLVACAICDGTRRMPTPAWQLSAFWENTLKLGGEMGTPFGKGLLHAARAGGEVLDLGPRGGKLGGDRLTAMQAVVQIAPAVRSIDLSGVTQLSPSEARMVANALVYNLSVWSVNLDGHALPVRELRGGLPDREKVASLDLSRRKLRDASAIVIAALLRSNTDLTSLNIGANGIGEDGFHALGNALLESTTSKLGVLKCDAFEVPAGAAELDLSRKRIQAGALRLLAGVVKQHGGALRELRLEYAAILAPLPFLP
jgi:hypothetical protein